MDKVKIVLIGAGNIANADLKIYTEMHDYMVDVTPQIDYLKNGNPDPFVTEMQHFVDCVLGKCECIAPAEQGIEILKILDAIYESARTGHEVEL